jgi:hypothetical protein
MFCGLRSAGRQANVGACFVGYKDDKGGIEDVIEYRRDSNIREQRRERNCKI